MAAFVSVNSDATDEENYGRIQVLQLPNEATNGPGLAANQISSDQDVRDEVFRFTTGPIRTDYGNLLTLPVGEGLMYIQPFYAARDATSPLTLQFVLVAYGESVGIGETLDLAIIDALGGEAETPTTPVSPGPEEPSPEPPSGTLPAEARRLLRLAADAYERADRLQRQGDTAGWAEAIEDARGHVERALRLLDRRAEQTGNEPSG
jgi:uncharacterized membrane protein (UPF0182 family)